VIILVAGLTGLVGGRLALEQFSIIRGKEIEGEEAIRPVRQPSLGRSLRVSIICLSLWFVPLGVLRWLAGPSSVFVEEAIFFSKAAVVTFGGAYSVLAYIAQRAVEDFEWLRPGEMQDGLGMAETTSGPLIMVVQFVGFMGAYRNPGELTPMAAGICGSIITVWVTFVPCFYWIFLGAPYIEQLRGRQQLNCMLSAITAAVVGVILNLAVWFSLHTLFGSVSRAELGPSCPWLPRWSTIDYRACGIALMAFVLTFYFRRGMMVTLSVCAVTGVAMYLVRY
jgi:chromate transporter